jgi:hypothetical protein
MWKFFTAYFFCVCVTVVIYYSLPKNYKSNYFWQNLEGLQGFLFKYLLLNGQVQQCSAVQCSAVQCSVLQYITEQCISVQCIAE